MQLDAQEKRGSYFSVSVESFPFTVRLPSKEEHTINDWDTLASLLFNPIHGRTPLQHAKDMRVRVGSKWKSISLESLSTIETVSHFLFLFTRARADYMRGYLFDGGLSQQPYILYGEGQAFDTIASAISEAELENIRAAKRQASNSNG